MDIRKIDIRLLYTLEAVHRLGTLTAAGEALGLSQPALSHALGRLRDMFGDPLFVRTSTGMRATPRADELAESARRILTTVKAELASSEAFDPKKLEYTFKLCSTDVGEMVVLPGLLKRLRLEAPGVRLITSTPVPHEQAQALIEGTIDLAIGPFPDLAVSGIQQELLYERGFRCLVAKDHPRITGDRISLEAFLNEAHIVAASPGRTEGRFERFLAERKLKRRVALSVPNILGVPAIVAGSELIATVPESVGLDCKRFKDIKVLLPPIETPSIRVSQFWGERFSQDPPIRWLRSCVNSLYQETSKSALPQ